MRKVRVKVKISGRVQGVFFRAYTLKQAKFLGLAGWVQNTDNGEVEAEFEGSKDKVSEMIVWCKEGSPSAKVDEVRVSWEKPEELEGFRIR